MRRAVKGLLALVVVAALLYAAFVGYVSWRSADALVHPGRPASTWTPDDVGLAFEPVALTASDGVPLAAWWMPADAAHARGTVVFLHGYGDSKNQSLAYAPFLHAAGYNVLAFDFRAHGASGGGFTTVGLDEARDVAAAVAEARARDGDRVALLGLSMGAAAGINAAAGLGVDAVVSDSGFATLQNIAANSITHFTDLPKYPYGPVAVFLAARMVDRDIAENQPVREAAGLGAPLLVIQGAADDIAFPDADGRAIAEAADAEYWLVDGASHVGAHGAAKAEYERRVLGFLGAHVR